MRFSPALALALVASLKTAMALTQTPTPLVIIATPGRAQTATAPPDTKPTFAMVIHTWDGYECPREVQIGSRSDDFYLSAGICRNLDEGVTSLELWPHGQPSIPVDPLSITNMASFGKCALMAFPGADCSGPGDVLTQANAHENWGVCLNPSSPAQSFMIDCTKDGTEPAFTPRSTVAAQVKTWRG